MATELGNNQIPQYTNFNVKFDNITKDGSPLVFNTVGAWIFCAGQTLSASGSITKASTGVASGDFSIVSASGYVSVAVRASELGYQTGQYYVQLFAQTSGNRISHIPKYINIVPGLQPTGV